MTVVALSVRDQFIFGGHTHFWSVLPESPPALKTWAFGGGGGGGGGGGYSCTFLSAPESVLYFSIGLGVHEILQVIPAKIIDERKKR